MSERTSKLLVCCLAFALLPACASSDEASSESDRCWEDTDCPSGEVCNDHICVRASTRCNDDDDCPGDLTCERGACVPVDTGSDGSDDLDMGVDETECLRPSDCPEGYSCVNNACQAPDTGNPDSPPDVPREPDSTPCTPGVDCPPDAEPDSPAECEGRDDGRLGESCRESADCCSGLCLGPVGGVGFCTERCSSFEECNPPTVGADYFCYDAGDDGRFCAFSDYGDSCEIADDCLGQICLKGLGVTGCSWQCSVSADCPPVSVCGPVYFDDGAGGVFALNACAPVGTTCTVDSGSGLNNCLSGMCITPDTGGSGFCSMFCNASDPDACPFGYACQVVETDVPPICVPQ